MAILSRIVPAPPHGIKYMLGGETWRAPADRSPVRLCCEEWGNCGPLEFDPSIPPNAAGFRVRVTEIVAPAGALGFAHVGDGYFWTDTDMYGRTAVEREEQR